MSRLDSGAAWQLNPVSEVVGEDQSVSNTIFDRVVRVGTHTGLHKLPSRLTEHFMVENKDRCIFRKNIGRALLAKEDDPFLADWDLDLTKREARELHSDRIDQQRKEDVERQVSNYIQNSFSFAVLPIADKEERLKLESKIISTNSLCDDCERSSNWLGQYSPKEKIRRSGLWLIQGLYKEPLSGEDMKHLQEITTSKRGNRSANTNINHHTRSYCI